MKNIYVDMDDVVAAWTTGVSKILGRPILPDPVQQLPDDDWCLIKKEKRFYRNLQLMPNAYDLMKWLHMYERQNYGTQIAFLTALSRDYGVPWASYDKVMWADEHFPGTPVFFGPLAEDKHKHANPGDILIDDRQSNISEWIAAGGIGHLYTDWPTCESWLGETLVLLPEWASSDYD